MKETCGPTHAARWQLHTILCVKVDPIQTVTLSITELGVGKSGSSGMVCIVKAERGLR